jgi:hypothetical protein
MAYLFSLFDNHPLAHHQHTTAPPFFRTSAYMQTRLARLEQVSKTSRCFALKMAKNGSDGQLQQGLLRSIMTRRMIPWCEYVPLVVLYSDKCLEGASDNFW